MTSPTIPQRAYSSIDQWKTSLDSFGRSLRVMIPGIVQSFDAAKQTVTVQPSIREWVTLGGTQQAKALPLLVDVPVVLPRAGGFTLTMPITAGDECLVAFADMCIDAWYQSGGSQNQQLETRRHDLSDGFALMGIWSQPRVLSEFSTTAAELRSDDGATKVRVEAGQITITATTVTVTATNATVNASGTAQVQGATVDVTGTSQVNVTAPNVSVSGSTEVNITGGNAHIDGKNFLLHTHTGGTLTGGLTGPVD